MKRSTRRPRLSAFALLALLLVPAGSGATAVESDFDLNGFSDLAAAFNAEQGSVRLVALLSASCGYCIKGYRYMRKLLADIPDPRLKMLVAWEPMLSGDTRALSLKMAKKVDDPRMVYQAWDPERKTGDAYTAVLSAHDDRWVAGEQTAWDVYFVYEDDVTWPTDEPTVPTYWQHQGAGQSEFVLNYTKLKQEIEARLARLPAAAEAR